MASNVYVTFIFKTYHAPPESIRKAFEGLVFVFFHQINDKGWEYETEEAYVNGRDEFLKRKEKQ